MMRYFRTIFLVSILTNVGLFHEAAIAADAVEEMTISSETSHLALQSIEGQDFRLEDLKKHKLVVIVAQGSSCPVLQKSYPDLLAIHREFEKRDVVFFLLSAAQQDKFREVKKEVNNFGVSKFLLQDPKQLWLQPMGLKTTGETVVLQPSSKGWRLLYRGAISDRINFDRALPSAKNLFLRNAIKDALAGRPVKVKTLDVFGCSITWIKR